MQSVSRLYRSSLLIRPSFSIVRDFATGPVCMAAVDSRSSIDEREVADFSLLAASWWDENGPLKALHSMNQIRVPWIRDSLSSGKSVPRPLSGQSILDVGCGGGILSEPLFRLGATVTGIDASADCIAVAQARSTSRLEFKNTTVEEMPEEQKFDAVVASEIVEHVNNPQNFLSSCVKLVKPGGLFFVTTLNKSYLAKVLGITVAEDVLGLVPRGTHDWEKFISPDDLRYILEREGCSVRLVHGMLYNPVCNQWRWISRTDINYALLAIKQSPD